MMNTRQATVDDARTIVLLNQHVQQLHAGALPQIFKPAHVSDEFVAFYVERLQSDNESIYLAEEDGQAVGYVHIKIRENPENFYAYARQDVVINEISINPEYYGSGIADQLTQIAVNIAHEHNIKRVILDVWDWNTRAKRFYEKQGFFDL